MTEQSAESQHLRIDHFEQRLISTRMPNGLLKMRELWIPDDKARAKHIEMLGRFYADELIATGDLRETTYVDGGLPGSRVLDNILPHKDSELFYMLDLKNAFRNVVYGVLRDKLVARDPASETELDHFLDYYAMLPPPIGLPQGAPCSPYLFNFYLEAMDHELDAFCAQYGVTYTRWLDDLTFSTPASEGVLGKRARHTINAIIEETPGMKVNHAKSRLHRLSKAPVTITGVSIYPEGQIEAAPHIIKAAHAAFLALDQAIRDDVFIVPNDLAVPNGYYGALTSMSQKPFSPRIRREIGYYHDVAGLAHNTMAIQDEMMRYLPEGTPPWEIPEEFRAYAKRSDGIRVGVKREEARWRLEARVESARTSSKLAERQAYDDAVRLAAILRVDIPTAFGLGLIVPTALAELDSAYKIEPTYYVGTEEEIAAERQARGKRVSKKAVDTTVTPLFDDNTFHS